MKNLLINALVVVLLLSCTEKKEAITNSENIEAFSIVGEWTVANIEFKNKDTTIIGKPWHKSIYIYTDNYYSIAAAVRDRPLVPVLKEGDTLDPLYFKEVYLGYISNSGTYKIVGDSLIHNIIVAKSPTVMNQIKRRAQHFKSEKDKLFLTNPNNNGATTLTLERLKD